MPALSLLERWFIKLSRRVASVQGIYFMISGIWPFLSISSFQAVTGPKTDLWLVKTVGVLLLVIGFVLWLSDFKNRISPETAILGIGSAVVLICIELIYVVADVISPVYLLDTIIETGLAAAWFHRLWFPGDPSVMIDPKP